MQDSRDVLDTVVSYAIGGVALAIVYFAFLLPPPTVPTPESETRIGDAIAGAAVMANPQSVLSQTYIGRVKGKTGSFHIDQILVNGKRQKLAASSPVTTVELTKAVDIAVQGWAIDSRLRRSASRAIAAVDGEYTIAPLTVDRPDVVSALKLSPEATRSGFALDIPTNDLGAGRHHIRFLVIGADGTSLLDTGTSIDVAKRANVSPSARTPK